MTKREKKIAIVMSALMVICVIVYFSPDSGTKTQKRKTHKAVVGKSAVPVGQMQTVRATTDPVKEKASVDLKNMIEQMRLSSYETDISLVKDPFKKLEPAVIIKGSSLEFSDLILSGIILDEEKEPVALINEQILKEGDVISGFRIEAIKENKVIIIKGMESFELKLFRDIEAE